MTARTLGYILSWTTYGTWLQGDERGYVSDAKVLGRDSALFQNNRQLLQGDPVRLSPDQCLTVHRAILTEAQAIGQTILALAVAPDHVHLVGQYAHMPIPTLVARYKTAARLALKSTGHTGKLWTRGYDKRYCFDKQSLHNRTQYTLNHKNI